MDGESKKIASAKSVLAVYFRHVVKYPWAFFFVFAGGVGIQIADIISPLFLRQFVNILATATPSVQAASALVAILVLFGLTRFLSWTMHRLGSRSIMYLEARVMADLTRSAFGYLIQHSYNFFASRFAGSLTHRVNKYSRAFEVIFDSIMLQFLPTFIFLAAAAGVLYWRHPLLGIALGVWAIIFVGFQVWVASLLQPLRIARAEADTKVTGSLADAVSNQSTTTLFAGVQHEIARFSKVVLSWRQATLRTWYADDWVWGAVGLFILAIEIGLLYAGVQLWLQGLLTVGDFVLIQAYLLAAFDRLVKINRELRRFYDAFADAGEMVAILEEPHEVKDAPRAKPLAVTAGKIECKDVDFYFHSTRPILKNFNLTIPAEQRMAFVGPSGAGKSTVTKLLLRLYDIGKGSIEIDGQNIARVTQESLRSAIAFVPQEPILFHRTLMENIRYGRRDATDEEVLEAAKKAHCHEFIDTLPQKYDTYVGERGVKLSGGERQRVAIARALLKNAPILILDEATSSLDSESESLIQDALDTLMKGKTVIVIAHRLSTIMQMDRIVVIEGGSIADEGTHEQLLEKGGLYQKLWNIQAGGFILDDAEEEEGLAEGGKKS